MAARSAGSPAVSYAIAFAYDGTARHRGSWDLIKKKSGSSSNPRSHSGSQVILSACCSAALPQFLPSSRPCRPELGNYIEESQTLCFLADRAGVVSGRRFNGCHSEMWQSQWPQHAWEHPAVGREGVPSVHSRWRSSSPLLRISTSLVPLFRPQSRSCGVTESRFLPAWQSRSEWHSRSACSGATACSNSSGRCTRFDSRLRVITALPSVGLEPGDAAMPPARPSHS